MRTSRRASDGEGLQDVAVRWLASLGLRDAPSSVKSLRPCARFTGAASDAVLGDVSSASRLVGSEAFEKQHCLQGKPSYPSHSYSAGEATSRVQSSQSLSKLWPGRRR